MEKAVEIIEYRWRTQPGRLQKTFGIAGVKLHAHGEVIPIGAAVAQHTTFASPQREKQKRPHHGEEESRINETRLGTVEVFHCAMGNLLDSRAGARSGTEVNCTAQGVFIKEELHDGTGDKIHGHNIEYRVRMARDGAPKASCVDLQRPVHHLEAGGDAGSGVPHDDAGTQYHAGKRTETRLYKGLSLGLGLFVGVAIALAHGKLVFAHQIRALAGHVGCTDVGEASKLARAARKIEQMIEPHCSSGVNHSGCFSRKAPVGGWIQPTVRLADVSRKNLNTRPLRR